MKWTDVVTLRERQIAHVREHQAGFDAHQTMPRDVAEYFGEYWDNRRPTDLYRGLCADLGIEPRKECLNVRAVSQESAG